jgi:hypothetical protein
MAPRASHDRLLMRRDSCAIDVAPQRGIAYVALQQGGSPPCFLGRFLPKLGGPHKGPPLFLRALRVYRHRERGDDPT